MQLLSGLFENFYLYYVIANRFFPYYRTAFPTARNW